MDKRQAAEQLRRAIQLFIATIGDEQALEVATVYPVYKIGLAYKKDDLAPRLGIRQRLIR